MSASHAMPALAAAAAIGVILAARWATTRPRRSRHGASAARPPWRRTAPAPDTTTPEAPDGPAMTAVKDAEDHVQHVWQQLQARPERPE
ncbi:hypothetical protein [Streptomyces galbus]|uniref:Uncharacterized protein n=1 Tax=Streptomyces galbus TaxID=33898 RepID=A0A4U5WWF7_STRGB|nr:hypothetical protein [Streptomyces galbus]TKT06600.1 hypothetical protein E4U92_26445 [Streptomyces galbus]